MSAVRILADDLTGALDAAAPFATSSHPVHLALGGPLDAGKQTISSESRELALEPARAAVRAAFNILRPGTGEKTLWFKKVDSVLRGWPVEETLELMCCLDLPACVFAPAFPEMGRRTGGTRSPIPSGTALGRRRQSMTCATPSPRPVLRWRCSGRPVWPRAS